MDQKLDVRQAIRELGRAARAAARALARADTEEKNRALAAMAKDIRSGAKKILAANSADVAQAGKDGADAAFIDRLTLTPKLIEQMAHGVEQVAQLADPVGQISERVKRPTGIEVARMRVPIGVIGIIYESRPNVTADAAALCVKSGNACILRGGSEALESNRAIAACVRAGLRSAGLPEAAVQLVDTADRAAVGELITLTEYVDLIVPRGGKELIERLARILSLRVVKGLDEAIEHIAKYGSQHTDAIVAGDRARAERFLREVDSSSVMWNASTRFADGYEYGLGAEVGISTDKLHARGPVGLEGLTTQKFVVLGHGEVRT